ncbi:hypothetical protein ACHOLT_11670 [Desulfitobacterium sp. Sab5]|uniref:hypothetical protein n=1 Tax=Desulfitobacterium nosdiversum TaxID=3375356 RepID=UPI003CF05A02
MFEDIEAKKYVFMFPYSKYYADWKPTLLRFLRASRSAKTKKSPIRSLALQLAILQTLFKIEQVIENQTKEQKMAKKDGNVIYNQRLRHILKDIADGLAWRLLGFNRPLMRLLSQNKAPGHIKTSTSKEDDIATRFVSGGHVLIHDITNILRIGDLTLIDPSGYPNVLEIKKSGKQILDAQEYKRRVFKGGDLSSQAQRIVEVDEAIKNGLVNLGTSKANLSLFDISIDSYLSDIEEVLNICNQQGYSERFIDKILFVRAYRLDSEPKPFPLKQTGHLHWFWSHDCFILDDGEVFRNRIPYSAYPFSDEMVLQLLSGEIVLESYLNIVALKKKLQKYGWKIKNNRSIEQISEQFEILKRHTYRGTKLFPVDIDNSIFTLWKDGFNLAVPVEMTFLITADFLKPEVLIDTAEKLFSLTEPTRTNGAYGIGFSNEKRIWV